MHRTGWWALSPMKIWGFWELKRYRICNNSLLGQVHVKIWLKVILSLVFPHIWESKDAINSPFIISNSFEYNRRIQIIQFFILRPIIVSPDSDLLNPLKILSTYRVQQRTLPVMVFCDSHAMLQDIYLKFCVEILQTFI